MSPTATAGPAAGFGEALRGWRQHRGLSQLGLSLEAGISPRHLSFLETGRSTPSQEMVRRLLDTLDVPLWDRNRLLLAAGYAPLYRESSLDDENLSQVRRAVRLMLERHEPYPAYAMDGAWNVIDANAGHQAVVDSFGEDAEEARNILRLICAPHLLRPYLVNWEEVTGAVLRRVRRQLDAPEPPAALAAVVEEVCAYPGVRELLQTSGLTARQDLFVPLEITNGERTQRWMTTLVTVGGALDVALDDLVIECFFPADEESERIALETAEAPTS